MVGELTDDEQQVLRKQLGDAHMRAQETFDSSVRTLAAAGVAVTVSLATALDDLGQAGAVAVFLFLTSLGCNVVSYATAQRDIRLRLESVWASDRRGAFGNRWTTWTFALNVASGVTLIAGGAVDAAGS